jgi:sRNA-binding regulator protein Hfq
MSISPTLTEISELNQAAPNTGAGIRSGPGTTRPRKSLGAPVTLYGHASFAAEVNAQRQAELFYLQKQIHAQTPMVIVLEDGERVEGIIEWYDRNSIKIRGRARSLVYKSAIKYMYKLGEGA